MVVKSAPVKRWGRMDTRLATENVGSASRVSRVRKESSRGKRVHYSGFSRLRTCK